MFVSILRVFTFSPQSRHLYVVFFFLQLQIIILLIKTYNYIFFLIFFAQKHSLFLCVDCYSDRRGSGRDGGDPERREQTGFMPC